MTMEESQVKRTRKSEKQNKKDQSWSRKKHLEPGSGSVTNRGRQSDRADR